MVKVTQIPEPVKHFYKAFSHANCPMCGKVLTKLWDNSEYFEGSMKVKRVTRTFRPCGCTAEWEPND